MELRLNKRQVVHCTTKNEATQCCQLAKSMGLTWSTFRGYDDTKWEKYKHQMCYEFSGGLFCNKDFYEEEYYQILTAQDFVTMHSEPFMGYFEHNDENAHIVTAILQKLGGTDEGMVYEDGYAFIDNEGGIDSAYEQHSINAMGGYNRCNLEHYMHLIEHFPDATKMIDQANELTELRKQLSELENDLQEERERNARMFSNQEKMAAENRELVALRNENAELANYRALFDAESKSHIETILKLNEAKVKADRWDAIPQLFCMRGDKKRYSEIYKIFHNLTNGDCDCFDYDKEYEIYIADKNGRLTFINDDSPECPLILATQTITELPPLEEKEDVEEFWLKRADFHIQRGVNGIWNLGLTTYSEYQSLSVGDLLPFTADTEKLIGTTNEPSKKYKFCGVKPYFNTDEQ